jgi:hypothetical protein
MLFGLATPAAGERLATAFDPVFQSFRVYADLSSQMNDNPVRQHVSPRKLVHAGNAHRENFRRVACIDQFHEISLNFVSAEGLPRAPKIPGPA